MIAGGDKGSHGGSGAYIYSGPHGAVTIGGGKGGAISGPGGNAIAGGKSGHVTIGPNGNVHAGGSKGAAVKGPGGKAIAGAHGAATVGPGGAAAHGSRGGAAVGPGGRAIAGGSRGAAAVGPGGNAIAAGSRGAVAVGPHGAVAGGGRAIAGRGQYGAGIAGTRFVAASDLRGQGTYVRNNFRYYNSFNPSWWPQHPGAWFAAGWIAGSAWGYPASWDDCSSYYGYPEDTDAIYYNYGDNVTYEGDSVYYDGDVYATQDEYAEQATEIAAAGDDAMPAEDEKWQTLGVFAMTKGEETSSNDIFQIALNKDGVLRGNYYNATTDKATPITGSLDKKTQRVAWRIDGQDDTVYDTGLYNLTQEQTTMLVHFGKDRTEQYKLFRIEQQSDAATIETTSADGAKQQ